MGIYPLTLMLLQSGKQKGRTSLLMVTNKQPVVTEYIPNI